MQQEPRQGAPASCRSLREDLTDDQRAMLAELDRYGRDLRFLRSPLSQPSIAFLYDAGKGRHVVLEEDGSSNEAHGHPIGPH